MSVDQPENENTEFSLNSIHSELTQIINNEHFEKESLFTITREFEQLESIQRNENIKRCENTYEAIKTDVSTRKHQTPGSGITDASIEQNADVKLLFLLKEKFKLHLTHPFYRNNPENVKFLLRNDSNCQIRTKLLIECKTLNQQIEFYEMIYHQLYLKYCEKLNDLESSKNIADGSRESKNDLKVEKEGNLLTASKISAKKADEPSFIFAGLTFVLKQAIKSCKKSEKLTNLIKKHKDIKLSLTHEGKQHVFLESDLIRMFEGKSYVFGEELKRNEVFLRGDTS